ncbi:MAG: DNA polymerase sliding clamp, partial [Candidatus Methanospirareceae archaeon]
MFKAKIDVGVLRECIEAITAVVDEGVLRISKEGLRLKAVDPANVAMVAFELQRDAFDPYIFENEMEVEIGVDFTKMLSIFGIGGRGEVELELDEEKHNLSIRMGSLSYTMSLIEPSAMRGEPKVPDLEFPVQIIVSAEEFRRAIKAAEKIGEHILLGVDGEVFYMEAEGETDKVRLELRREQLLYMTPGTLHSLYSLDYVSAMSKG